MRKTISVISALFMSLTMSFTAVAATDTASKTAEKEEINYLTLVNKQNRLPDDWESIVELEKTTGVNGKEIVVEKKALEQFKKLQKDVLENDGVDIELDSVYRSVAAQEDLWQRFTEEYGIDYVKKYVAVPGFSEHHTGLAIDVCLVKDGVVIDDNDDMIAEKDIFAKVHAKLADYGFILRYLPGRKDSTGYAYEPWHFRYIDSPEIAKEIEENEWTLEEYLDYKLVTKNTSPEWVQKLADQKNVDQIFVIAAVRGSTAYVSMHEKTADGWKEIISTPGYIGKNGLGKTKEGDYKTPVGDYHFDTAFGIADDPGCTGFEYTKVSEDDYWSCDMRPDLYNRFVSIKDYPDLDLESEHIVDYKREYQYCLNINYNKERVPGLGNAIFLHCLGAMKPYTGGCVAIPEENMKEAVQHVKPECLVVIDTLENLSPETWAKLGLQ
ncbi:MAG: D-alanyl-D-alanine carboxypeptidase family protein [Clostridia bacterium]|nr:D-alanyl-D-alanine carboxypeptidase family protein [Clostridia bacterium]